MSFLNLENRAKCAMFLLSSSVHYSNSVYQRMAICMDALDSDPHEGIISYLLTILGLILNNSREYFALEFETFSIKRIYFSLNFSCLVGVCIKYSKLKYSKELKKIH